MEFPETFLRATLVVSLLTVWVLVVLFAYLNRYTKREYFTIWTLAWLCYALWLTLNQHWENPPIGSLPSIIQQATVALSAAFLLWGTLCFLDLPVPQRLFGLFIFFLIAWSTFLPQITTNRLQVQLPVFLLMGAGSAFAGSCFYRLRRRLPFVGAGLLAFGFLLWGAFLGVYPVAVEYAELRSVGYLIAAVLQLFIAVSMIVLVLEEVRYNTDKINAEITRMRSEKRELEAKILGAAEEVRRVYDQVRLTEGSQQAYDELRRTQQAVVQQERLRALGQMASGLAHDINNALCPISAYAELLSRALVDAPPAQRRYLQNIQTAAEDIAAMVARMRDFYRPRSGQETTGSITLGNLVPEVIELTRPRWRNASQRDGRSLQVVAEVQPGLPDLAGDPAELREALINLVFNAIDALPRGGRIVIKARELPPSPGQARSRLSIEVTDDGVGMDEATRERCLEPFFTTKAQRGTGLGLSMVYGMMRRHEGDLEIESEPGKGTTVRLIFSGRGPAQKAEAPAAADGATRRALRILCADDEEKIRLLLLDCLGGAGHQVTVVSNGEDALRRIDEAIGLGCPPDIVITDLGMPGMDGHQLAREVKRRRAKLPVVMLTGWGAIVQEEGGPGAAVDCVLGKPPKLDELEAALYRLVPA